MPCIRRTPKERKEQESRIQAALNALRIHSYNTPGEAARAYGVHPTTLRNRWLGKRKDVSTAHLSQQLLTVAQREALASWCIHLSLSAQPLDRTTIGQYVHSLCGTYPSTSWVDRFLHKHEALVLRSVAGIDPKRARAFNEGTVARHFELYGSVVRDKDIPKENTYNMDEKGIQLGGGRKRNGRKFICGRDQHTSLKLQDPNLELVTVVECTSASGDALSPGFILTGTPGHYCEEWYERDGVGSVAVSPNGWTDDDLTYLWFVKVFVPQAMARNTSGKPIMLIMDGHGSHCTDQMHEYGYNCNPRVHIYLLPPHTTHRLQPLDVGVFGVAQRRWSRLCDQRTMEGNMVTRDTVVSEWMDLRPTFMREDIIRSSFAKTGLHPFNPNVFVKEDFKPSNTYSVQTHLPSGYPLAEHSESNAGASNAQEAPVMIEQDTPSGPQTALEHPYTNSEVLSDSRTANPMSNTGALELARTEPLTLLDALPRPGTRLHTKSQLLSEVARLRECLASSIHQTEVATAHAKLMAKENEGLRKKVNTKKRGGKKKLTTDARLVTSDEYVSIRRKEIEEEAREAKKTAEQAEKRQQDQTRRDQQRTATAHTVIWNTGWRNRKKEDLKDLCHALGMSMEGTRGDMVKRVEAYLVDHPSLSQDYRFRGLFLSTSDGAGQSQVTVM